MAELTSSAAASPGSNSKGTGGLWKEKIQCYTKSDVVAGANTEHVFSVKLQRMWFTSDLVFHCLVFKISEIVKISKFLAV